MADLWTTAPHIIPSQTALYLEQIYPNFYHHLAEKLRHSSLRAHFFSTWVIQTKDWSRTLQGGCRPDPNHFKDWAELCYLVTHWHFNFILRPAHAYVFEASSEARSLNCLYFNSIFFSFYSLRDSFGSHSTLKPHFFQEPTVLVVWKKIWNESGFQMVQKVFIFFALLICYCN